MHYVYVIKGLNKIYTGRSDDLKRRIKEHLIKKSWTSKRLKPEELIFYEAFKSKKDCIRREKYFKTSKGGAALKQIIRESLK